MIIGKVFYDKKYVNDLCGLYSPFAKWIKKSGLSRKKKNELAKLIDDLQNNARDIERSYVRRGGWKEPMWLKRERYP